MMSNGIMVGAGWWGSGGGGGAKSAVQLLQESKSRYVKSDHVLGTQQQPQRPDRFHISSNPNIFLSAPAKSLHVSRTSPSPGPQRRHSPTDVHKPELNGHGHPNQSATSSGGKSPTALTPENLALISGPPSLGIIPPPLPSRSPRVTPRPRAKTQPVGELGGLLNRGGDLRRSLSHGPGDRSDDIQMKLRKLLNTDSRENLVALANAKRLPVPPPPPPRRFINRKLQNGVIKVAPPEKVPDSGTFRAEPATVTVHKSLPDLCQNPGPVYETDSESGTTNSLQKRRPSCPGSISLSTPPTPPPRPPRMFRDPPKVPARPSPKTPVSRVPPPVPARTNLKRSGTSTGALINTTDGRRSSDSDISVCGGPDESKRRPILRSKSDVTHERCANGGPRWDDNPERDSVDSADLEDFFNSMGLDSATQQEMNSPVSQKSAIYFEDISSEDSGPRGRRRGSSDSDEANRKISGPGKGTSGGVNQPRGTTGEPSIVEKNARVIKWLFNCQKAQTVSKVRSTTVS